MVLGSALLVTMYGETMLLPAIPDIIRDFKISHHSNSEKASEETARNKILQNDSIASKGGDAA